MHLCKIISADRRNTEHEKTGNVGQRERGGAVVECRPHDQEVVGSIPGHSFYLLVELM
jgi:hypothetical protein